MATIQELFSEAVAAQKAGNLDDAIAAYQQVLEMDPHSFTALNNLGLALHAVGRIEEALDCYHRVLASRDDAQTRSNLGNALRALGKKGEAIKQYRKALELNADKADIHSNLGVTLAEHGKVHESLAHLEKAVELSPDSAHVHCNLGNARQAQGRMREAVELYLQAIELNPEYAEAHNNLGNALLALGRHDEAVDHFQRAVELRPWLGGAQRQLAKLRPAAIDTEAIETMLADRRLPRGHRIELHFALGEVLQDRGEHDPAFAHYAEANRLKHRSVRFCTTEHNQEVDQLIALCTPEFFEQRSDFGVNSEQPVLIVGMPRSGTSLVEQILASHSAVHGDGEAPYLPGLVQRLTGTAGAAGCATVLRHLHRDGSGVLAREYLKRLSREAPESAVRITDKLPDNFLRLGLVRLLMPRARIIHCTRDPCDTALSLFFHSFVGTHQYAWDLKDIGAYYRDYLRLMEHWKTVLPPENVLEVHYETLVTAQEEMTRRMIDFLGLEWDPACLDFYHTERVVTSASNTEVRRPLYSDAVGRWHAYEKHMQPFLAALGQEP